jgi:GT2 family glycosyltransferase
MVDLSIIIVSYNTKEFLKKCLLSIKENITDHFSYEIIVVDNASTDGVVDEAFEEEKQLPVKIMLNKENLGFSKANNIGVKAAKGRYILFLNPDTEVKKHAIEEMIAFMDHQKDAGAATCQIDLPNGKIDDASHRGFPTPWNSLCYFSGLTKLFPKSKLFAGYTMGWKNLQHVHKIDALAGAFMIVRREAGEQIGWWDEDYFFYGEDLEFCYQLKQKGWNIYYVPHVSILHQKGVSGGIKSHSQEISTATTETKKRATKARFDAMRIFYKKHYVKQYPKIVTWLVIKGIDVKQQISS